MYGTPYMTGQSCTYSTYGVLRIDRRIHPCIRSWITCFFFFSSACFQSDPLRHMRMSPEVAVCTVHCPFGTFLFSAICFGRIGRSKVRGRQQQRTSCIGHEWTPFPPPALVPNQVQAPRSASHAISVEPPVAPHSPPYLFTAPRPK